MGRNKIKIEKISNERIRQVTFYKRKRGLLKKAMELSLLCDAKVFLGIVDKNEKLMVFSSGRNACEFIERYLTIPIKARERYTDEDYKTVFPENEKEISSDSKTDSDREMSKKNTEGNGQRKPKVNTKQTPQKANSASISQKDQVVSSNNSSGISKIKNKLSLKVLIPNSLLQSVENNSDSKHSQIINPNTRSKEHEKKSANNNNIKTPNSTANNISNSTQLLKELKTIIDKKTTPTSLIKTNFVAKRNINASEIFFEPNEVYKTPNKTPTKSTPVSSPKGCYPMNYTMTSINPLNFQNDCMNHKRFRGENFLSSSPNLSAEGSLKQLTPLIISTPPMGKPTPAYFMFNPNNSQGNSLTATPLNQGCSQGDSFEYSSIRTYSYSNDKNLNEENVEINQCKGERSFTFCDSLPKKEEGINSNNSAEACIESPNARLRKKMGFYAWVMSGASPTEGSKVLRANNKIRKQSTTKKR